MLQMHGCDEDSRGAGAAQPAAPRHLEGQGCARDPGDGDEGLLGGGGVLSTDGHREAAVRLSTLPLQSKGRQIDGWILGPSLSIHGFSGALYVSRSEDDHVKSHRYVYISKLTPPPPPCWLLMVVLLHVISWLLLPQCNLHREGGVDSQSALHQHTDRQRDRQTTSSGAAAHYLWMPVSFSDRVHRLWAAMGSEAARLAWMGWQWKYSPPPSVESRSGDVAA